MSRTAEEENETGTGWVHTPRHHRATALIISLLLALLFLAGCQENGPIEEATATATEAALALVSPTPAPPEAGREATPAPSLPTLPPTAAASPAATPPATIGPSPTPLPRVERTLIGHSVQERPIELVRLGNGLRRFVAIGALHGGHECNTYELLLHILDRFEAQPEALPPDVTLYVLPLANPDGCELDSRENANGVDLNRNWDTPDWSEDIEGPFGPVAGGGGPEPFSEPETAALRDWLLALQAEDEGLIRILSHHSAVPPTGAVLPGYEQQDEAGPLSEQLGLAYAGATGYLYSEEWVGVYEITGEFVHWAELNGFAAVDVELPDRGPADSIPEGWNETHVETNWRGLMAVLAKVRRRRLEVTMVPQPMFQAIAPNRLALSVEDKDEQQENRKATAPNRNDRLAYTSGIDTKGEIEIISIVNDKNSEAPLPMLS
jgi:hypothetical protein